LLVSAFPEFEGDAVLSSVVVTFSDITERKRTEDLTQLRFATALHSIGEGLVITDPEGTIQYVNPAFEQISGYSYAELLGGNPRMLQSGQHDETFYRTMWETIAAGQVWKGSFVDKRKDGRLYDQEATIAPIKEPSGHKVGYVAVSRDVTARKAAERAVLENEALIRAIVETAVDGIITIDERGTIETCNTAVEKIFGYSRDEMIGRNVSMLMPSPYREEHDGYIAAYRKTGQAKVIGLHRELVGRRRDGSTLPLDLAVNETHLGNRRFFTGIVRDVTEHQRLMREIAANLDIQRSTAEILRASLAPLPLEALLDKALESLLAVPWLGQEPAGCIFLLDDDDPNVLVLRAHRRLPAELVRRCGRVSVGQCLCGTAASKQEIVFANEVDDRHTLTTPGMPPHGHYGVPILTDGQVLGVLNVYIAPDHQRREEEEKFLLAIADVLAGLVRRKRAEIAHQNSEERFELAVRGTDAGIWDWDLRTNQVYFSPRWKGMLGYGSEEMSNDFSEWETRLHPDDRERALATVRDYLDGRSEEYELEHRLRHKDGAYRWILARGAAVFDEQGRAYRIVGSQLDITQRRNAEERLRENQAQLVAAQRIQERLLPQSPPKVPGLDIAGACFPAEYAAGDYFDFLKLSDGAEGFVIADVMGHGVGPALLMATTSAYMRSLAAANLPMPEMVCKTNEMLCQQTEGDRFVSLLLCRLDRATGSCHYVNAGHQPGYVIDAAGSVKATLGEGDLPLGMLPDIEYAEGRSVDLTVGDTVLLLTDGLLEACSPEDVLFGKRRVLDFVCAHRDRPARELIGMLRREVSNFTGVDTLRDDLTLIVVKVVELPNASP
jgi:PAS domain S-box-containing protein